MFPTANSQIDYNEDGEVLGWSDCSYDEPEYCDACGFNHRGECPPVPEYDNEESPHGDCSICGYPLDPNGDCGTSIEHNRI